MLKVGDRLGPYEVLGVVGAGGMGVVYRARDVRLGREVALKIIGATASEDPEALARFTEEARVLAAMSNPDIVAIFDFGTRDGVTFAVMELLDGETLGQRLRRGVLPWRTAVGIAVRIARGLAAAHESRVVHRDLKPDNVFLLRTGGVKVLDFGLAVLRREGGEAPELQEAGFAGTKVYMAPEQVCKQGVDARTDIFALGVVIYEMLCGRRPFDRLTVADTMTAIVQEEVPPFAAHDPSVPDPLFKVIKRCLAKDPAGRFQNAFDLAFELSDLLATPGPVELARLSLRQRLQWLGIGALLGAAVASLVALLI
jgi:eukaryotic-like serine/threonine-protein kinase